jgi:SRSO17 transposase
VRYELRVEDIRQHAHTLAEFHVKFVKFFPTTTRSVASHALDYLKGQLLLRSRRNMSRMSAEVVDKNEQALSHFISNSPWKDEPLIEAIGKDAVELLSGDKITGALILDESGIPKQGTESVGVARQYCGTLGKVDNCQVGVFLSYSVPTEATLIDRRLFLPQKWIDDPERCKKAGIPPEARQFRTKAQLGLEMILKAKERGIPFAFVGMDAHYGEQPWLLSELERSKLVYVADIPCNTRVYLEYPQIGIPERKGERGRVPGKLKVLQGKPVEVRKLLPSDRVAWHVIKVRDTQRGELWIRFAALWVWRIEDEVPRPQPVWLLIRQELDGSDVKFSFCNAPRSTPIETLAECQSRRYWVERSLQDAKGLAGLDEYQVTGWKGWHHHMSMVLLAMLFLLYLKRSLAPKAPMITLQDALEILRVAMPKKELSFDEAVELIHQKHLNRFRSRNCRLNKQQAWLKELGVLI